MAEGVHPAARILAWGCWAVGVELAAPHELPLLAVAAATAFLFAPVRARFLALARRTRWLLLALALTYAWTLPGAPVWPAAGWVSPSVEGLEAGALRVVRLALLIAGLAALIALTERSRLILGLYTLAKPLQWLGFDRRAFVVRLGLTLDYSERAAPPRRWLDALRAHLPDDGVPARYVMHDQPWRLRDSAVILAGLVLIASVWA